MADRRCAVCDGAFVAPPSAKTVTCSKACSSIHRSRMHVGKRNTWSETAREAKRADGQTSNLRRGTPAAKVSPRAGAFESNVNAKVWCVISPDGDRYDVRNLRLWCETHADLFSPHPWRNAYAGLLAVAAWYAGKRSRQVSQWRGWTLKDAPRRPAARMRDDFGMGDHRQARQRRRQQDGFQHSISRRFISAIAEDAAAP